MEININPSNHTSATSVTISRTGNVEKNANDVTFVVKYPEGYTGPKHMPEGPTVTSKESAEIFKSRGIGYILGEGEEATTDEQGNAGAGSGSLESGNNQQNNTGEINPDELTKDQLQEELTKREITFASNAKKPDLVALLKEALEKQD